MQPIRSPGLLATLAAVVSLGAPLGAQETVQPPLPPPLEVGVEAPDFALPAATRWGELADPIRLSDYRGKTVVLAFFFKARTKG